MYDIIFIDDKFSEIETIYFDMEREGIRCYYSDGDESSLPSNDKKDYLKFKNVMYICLDLHLENRGISVLTNNNNAYSTLAGIINKFKLSTARLIVNSSFSADFAEEKLKKYLGNKNTEIIVEEKERKFSTLRKTIDEIKENAKITILRNIVIREAIDVENLLQKEISNNISSILKNDCNKVFDQIKNFNFSAKITLYSLLNQNKELQKKLGWLKKERNKWAHEEYSNEKHTEVVFFLEELESIIESVKSFKKQGTPK